jgi:hypothetical protein
VLLHSFHNLSHVVKVFRDTESSAASGSGATPHGYPLLRGQNRITKTITQTTPQPIHVMFG